MHESLQPPKLSKSEGALPRELAAAQGAKGLERKRVAMQPITPEMARLNASKMELEEEMKELQELIALAPDKESAAQMEADLENLEKNHEKILESLAGLAPEAFGDEAAFEKMLKEKSPREKEKAIEAAEKKKDDSEDRAHALKGKLRLDKSELAQVVGKNAARSGQLEQQIRETEAELVRNDANRLEAWKALKTLDPETFGADADIEIAEAAHEASNLKKATDEEIEDVLASLHEHIDKS